MLRTELPRIHELRDLDADSISPDAYFREFEDALRNSSLAREFYLSLEQELRGLDEDAWKSLRTEASQYLSAKDERGRDWQQLFDILNQAYAYNHLKEIGCSSIRFIPRSKPNGVRTPDLEGSRGFERVICEVKTISISDAEVDSRRHLIAQDEECLVDERFFRKLNSVIGNARSQLLPMTRGKTLAS
jgi:hypothetical protein